MHDDPFDRMWLNIKRQLYDDRSPTDLPPINPYPTVPYTISYAREIPPAIALTPEMEKDIQKVAEEMTRQWEAQFLGVSSLQVWNKPVSRSALILEDLHKLRQALDAKDPLLQKGIQRDWLCILNPATERLLKDLVHQGLITLPPRWEEFRLMDELMGRVTHVIEGAHDGIVYMDERIARWAYPAYFARLDEERLEMLRSLDIPMEASADMRDHGIDYDLKACLEYNPQEGYSVDDIAEVLAVWEGQNEGDDWRWILRLNDDRFVFLQGWCDFTGWDCQSRASSNFAPNPIEALALGMSSQQDRQDVHTDLMIQLNTAKKKTWRENKDDDMGNPPFVGPFSNKEGQ